GRGGGGRPGRPVRRAPFLRRVLVPRLRGTGRAVRGRPAVRPALAGGAPGRTHDGRGEPAGRGRFAGRAARIAGLEGAFKVPLVRLPPARAAGRALRDRGVGRRGGRAQGLRGGREQGRPAHLQGRVREDRHRAGEGRPCS